MEKTEKIWLDGKFVDWERAQIHVLTHTLHYGLGVFEGIRCYEGHDGKAGIFRLKEHIERLVDSAHIVGMKLPYDAAELSAACVETVRVNGLKSCYIRPIAFLGDGEMGLAADNPVRVAVAAWPWGSYLGEEGVARGIRAKTASFQRFSPNSLMTKAKVCGHYVNSILATKEVRRSGYDEALLLDSDGYVSEGSGENIFVVRRGVVRTPPLTSALPGITRDTVMVLLRELGVPLEEKNITRDELYVADEVFMTGTAAEVTPIREVDDRQVGSGKPGPVTQKLQRMYRDVTTRRLDLDKDWVTVVPD
ncbi:MAG: branched chain amino acid aminotransferase [Candidatus Binatia bacterium]|nr:MAG: branched chain amino acid aminotransferase [Candidatus Binatia bacterium]